MAHTRIQAFVMPRPEDVVAIAELRPLGDPPLGWRPARAAQVASPLGLPEVRWAALSLAAFLLALLTAAPGAPATVLVGLNRLRLPFGTRADRSGAYWPMTIAG